MPPTTWTELAEVGPVRLAVDTEFEGKETLTVQFAARIGDEVRVQLYHAPDLVAPPPRRRVRLKVDPSSVVVNILEPKVISSKLSPARVLADLFQLSPGEYLSRGARDDRAARAPTGTGAAKPGRIELVLVAHFLRADLLRAFGRRFLWDLLAPADGPPAVALRDGKTVGFTGTGAGDRFRDPVVEYVWAGRRLFEVRLGTFDTNCACGPARLDDLARSYLGATKDASVSATDKERMGRVFRDPKRAPDAYRYAARDAALTLLVAERMEEQHTQLYAALALPAGSVPPMHGTPGMRVSTLVLQHVRHTAAAGSTELGAKREGDAAGLNKVKDLFRRGSAERLSDGRGSRFGKQTGDTHGGLLHSRTPGTFFHRAVGQFRDVDLESCYPAIIGSMTIYLGEPLVLEPGHDSWPLSRAVAYLEEHADGPDAWFVKVSGPIGSFPNTLIPSTIDALTGANYKSRDGNRARRKANVARLDRKRRDWGQHEQANDRKYAAVYTDEVQAGIVTRATWLLIQALPPHARSDYEQLRAETIVFYPKKLAAASGAEFDERVKKYRTGRPVDWAQALDLAGMTRTTVEDIDEKYVSLRYRVGELAGRLVELRRRAGKDSAAGRLYKTLANTVYGAFASPFLPTSNPVAANVITGTARALAYALGQSLNALLTITDGVLYRRDRIPSGTFAERLGASGEYPLRHAATGSFVDPATVPTEDRALSEWYARHVMRFFGVEGRKEYERLFCLHTLAHKPLPAGGTAFDGVFLDGGANYGKLVRTKEGTWNVAEMKARSFQKHAKEELGKWLLCAYQTDQFLAPPPPVPAGRLLGVREALVRARCATRGAAAEARVIVPLGIKLPSITTYKLIKLSAFVFRSASQRERMLTDWERLTRKTRCGLELLALRRTFGGKLSAVAEAVFRCIRDPKNGRLAALNVDRLYRPGSPGDEHAETVLKARKRELEAFVNSLVIGSEAPLPRSGLVVERSSLATVASASDDVS